jgi:hypothetical protein
MLLFVVADYHVWIALLCSHTAQGNQNVLIHAAANGHTNFMRMLFEGSVDIDVRDQVCVTSLLSQVNICRLS